MSLHAHIYRIFSKWSVCLWTRSLFLAFLCTFNSTTTPSRTIHAGYEAGHENGKARTPRPADDSGALFTGEGQGATLRAGFEECRWDDGPVCAWVWMQMCVNSSATVCLPSSYVHKSMATCHCGLPVLQSRSFLFFWRWKNCYNWGHKFFSWLGPFSPG